MPDRESDRREESSPASDTSRDDSSDQDSTDRESREEEEASSEDSEEYSPEEEEDEEESEPEDLAMIEHRARLVDREENHPRYRPERTRERTETLFVSQSVPNRSRRKRRRRGRRRSRRRRVTSTSYQGEYDDYEEPEDDRREDDDLRLEAYDDDDSDLYTGEYTAYEVAMELHRRYEQRELAYQRDYERWCRRPGEYRYNDPRNEDTRLTCREDDSIPMSLYGRCYPVRNDRVRASTDGTHT